MSQSKSGPHSTRFGGGGGGGGTDRGITKGRTAEIRGTQGCAHRSVTPKFVSPTAPSCIDNSWKSTTPPAADSASSNQTLPFQNEHEWVYVK